MKSKNKKVEAPQYNFVVIDEDGTINFDENTDPTFYTASSLDDARKQMTANGFDSTDSPAYAHSAQHIGDMEHFAQQVFNLGMLHEKIGALKAEEAEQEAEVARLRVGIYTTPIGADEGEDVPF